MLIPPARQGVRLTTQIMSDFYSRWENSLVGGFMSPGLNDPWGYASNCFATLMYSSTASSNSFLASFSCGVWAR